MHEGLLQEESPRLNGNGHAEEGEDEEEDVPEKNGTGDGEDEDEEQKTSPKGRKSASSASRSRSPKPRRRKDSSRHRSRSGDDRRSSGRHRSRRSHRYLLPSLLSDLPLPLQPFSAPSLFPSRPFSLANVQSSTALWLSRRSRTHSLSGHFRHESVSAITNAIITSSSLFFLQVYE